MEKLYKILKLVILVLALVAVLLGAKLLYDGLQDKVPTAGLPVQTEQPTVPAEEQQTQPRERVPDILVYDDQGRECRLSDFRGKPVILNFWASWCGPCKSEMPAIEEKYQQYGDQIHFWMVDLTDGGQETRETGAAFIREMGYTFPVYYDLDFSGAMGYSVSSIPVTYFIDSDGYLAAWYPGAMDEEILQQGIDILLSGN